MKKIIIVLMTWLVIASCSTAPQEKAEKAISTFLKENLKNPTTYKSLQFSPVDTVFQADTLKENLNYLVEWYNSFIESEKFDSTMLDFYKRNYAEKYQERLDYIENGKRRKDSLNQIISDIKSKIELNDVQSNIVEYRLKHDYSHKGLDDEMVVLKLNFVLDKDFKVKKRKLQNGINGQAYFDITILSKDASHIYIEFVVDPKFDDQIINSDGITDLHVKAGKHYLTWTASNKNGFGILTNPETFRKEILLEDSENNESYFVINGKKFWTYKNKVEAEKDDYYNKYIIGE